MKKILLLVIVLISTSVYGKMDRSAVKRTLRNAPTSTIKKVVKGIDKSNVSDISKRINIRRMNEGAKLDIAIDSIVKNGKSAELLLKEGPIETIKLYSKHGKKFIEVYKVTEHTILGIPFGTRKELIKIIPKQNPIVRMLGKMEVLTDSDIAKRFLKVMKTTGDRGYELSAKIAKYAKKHPKSTAVSAMYLWFLADPTGFDKALKKSGDNLSEFSTDIVGTALNTAISVPLDVADTAGKSVVNSIGNHITPVNFIIIFLLLVGLLIWKFREKTKVYYKKIAHYIKNRSSKRGPL